MRWSSSLSFREKSVDIIDWLQIWDEHVSTRKYQYKFGI